MQSITFSSWLADRKLMMRRILLDIILALPALPTTIRNTFCDRPKKVLAAEDALAESKPADDDLAKTLRVAGTAGALLSVIDMSDTIVFPCRQRDSNSRGRIPAHVDRLCRQRQLEQPSLKEFSFG